MAKKNLPTPADPAAEDPAPSDPAADTAADPNPEEAAAEEESPEPRITEGGDHQTYKMEWAPGVGKADNVCVGKIKYKARPDGSFRVSGAHVPDLQRAGLRVVY